MAWETIAHLPVDAGCMMIVDPCYVLDDEAVTKDPTRSIYLSEICTDWVTHKSIFGDLGVVVQTGYGDGEYPVQIRKNEEGRVVEVRVKFD